MDATLAVERYLRHQRTSKRSPATVEYHRKSLLPFLAHAGVAAVEDLGAEHLRAYLDHLQSLGRADDTVAGRCKSVKAWGNWLVAEEYATHSPFRKVAQPPGGGPTRTALAPEDAAKLLRQCDRDTALGSRDFALLLLLFSTGLRLAEALALELQDLDRPRQLVLVRRGKGGKSRQVPLSRPVERALDKYLDRRRDGDPHLFLNQHGAPLSKRGAQFLIRKYAERAGVVAHAHLFRHGCAVQYLRNGGRLETLRLMLGHAKMDQTLHYAKLAGVDLVEAHERADPVRALHLRV